MDTDRQSRSIRVRPALLPAPRGQRHDRRPSRRERLPLARRRGILHRGGPAGRTGRVGDAHAVSGCRVRRHDGRAPLPHLVERDCVGGPGRTDLAARQPGSATSGSTPALTSRIWVTSSRLNGGRVFRSVDSGVDVDRPFSGTARAPDQRGGGASGQCEPGLGGGRQGRLPVLRRRRLLGEHVHGPSELHHRRPALPPRRPRAPGRHAEPRRVGVRRRECHTPICGRQWTGTIPGGQRNGGSRSGGPRPGTCCGPSCPRR